jgi:hypothetical protein
MLCYNHAGTGTAAHAAGGTAGTGTAGGVGLESLRDDWGIAVTGKSIGGDVNSIALVLCVTKLQKVVYVDRTGLKSRVPESRWHTALPTSHLVILDRRPHAQSRRSGTDVSLALCIGAWVSFSQAASRLECQWFTATDRRGTMDVVERVSISATAVDAPCGVRCAPGLASSQSQRGIQVTGPGASPTRRTVLFAGFGYTGTWDQTCRERARTPTGLSSCTTDAVYGRPQESPVRKSGEKSDVEQRGCTPK